MRSINKNKGEFYIYGKNPVAELLKDKPKDVQEVAFVDFTDKDKNEFKELLSSVRHAKIPTRYLSKREAEQLVGSGVRTQRVLAKLKSFKYLTFKEWQEQIDKLGSSTAKLVLVLDKIEDPQNFGAIVRSAGAVGVSAVFVANTGQAPVTATVFKTSAGVITKVPIVQVANISNTLEKLKKAGFWSYGVDMYEPSQTDEYDTGSKSTFDKLSASIWDVDFDNNTVLVVGAEGGGLSRVTREHCDFLVHIPMQEGVESLNVSVAAALAMYEWRRQQS